MCDRTSHTGKDPALSEFGLIAYIDAAERAGGPVRLMQLYAAALAHPLRLTRMLETLTDCKLITIAPDGAAALDALRPALEKTRALGGPLLKTVTPDRARAAARRGVTMQVGDTYTDAGMAVIAFNRAAGALLRRPAMMKFIETGITLTDRAREVLTARGLNGAAPPEPPSP
jgi:hypothetical protein